MKLIMENWRKYLTESKSTTWKQLDLQIRKQNNNDEEIFYLTNEFLQRYSSEMHSLFAKRRGEDKITKSKKGLKITPKGQSFSPDLRWSYEEKIRPRGADAASWSTTPPQNMPKSKREQGHITIDKRIHAGLKKDADDRQTFRDVALVLVDFIRRPENIHPGTPNIYDYGAAKEYLKFLDFFRALSFMQHMQHEIGHHIQFNMDDASDIEVYKEIYGEKWQDVFENCYDAELAVTSQDIKLLRRAIPIVHSDFRNDNLPGALKWKTWVDPDPESHKEFIKVMTSLINKDMTESIRSMENYHNFSLSNIESCLEKRQ